MSHLPDCMMPDGADPCVGYSELRAENERLHAENSMLVTDAALHDKESGDNVREISRLNTHINKLDVEIERLRAERANCPPASESEYVRRLESDLIKLEAEIERLRAGANEYHKQLKTARAEKAELLAVLEAIEQRLASSHRIKAIVYAHDLARAAIAKAEQK